MIFVIALLGTAIVTLAHALPAPFLFDALAGDRAVWHMPRTDPPTVYLTYDDGPNPATTGELLDLLGRERVSATFFLIDRHITDETAPLVRRMFAEGHAVALHSAAKSDMLLTSAEMARKLTSAADRVEAVAGARPCRAFRPRGGWRSRTLFGALEHLDYKLVGWGWMLWDVELFQARSADRTVARVTARVSPGDIIVMHDGNDGAPRTAQRHTVEATARLIAALHARGLRFGTVCGNGA